MALTTVAKLADYLGRNLTTDESDYFTSTLSSAVDQYVEFYTNQSFTAGTGVDRYYDGGGDRWLSIDPFSTLTTVAIITNEEDGTDEVSETLTANDEYIAYPLNATYKNMLYRSAGTWPRGRRNIKITGNVGYSTPPALLSHAATMLAAGYLDSNKDLKRETIEGYSREFGEMTRDSDELRSALNFYKVIQV